MDLVEVEVEQQENYFNENGNGVDFYDLACNTVCKIKNWCAYNAVPLANNLSVEDMKDYLEGLEP